MEYIIREAKLEETNKVDELLTKLIRDEKQYDDNINEYIFIIDYYKNVIGKENNYLLVAIVDNEIVGYLYGFIKDDGTYNNKISKLDALYVEEAYRKNKIADSLIKQFKEWSKEKQAIKMEVNVCSDNVKAKNLYNKNDFKSFQETLVAKL